jgi:ABC-type Fe3+ transport system permease subunit
MAGELFNPFYYVDKGTYLSFWERLLSTVFLGFWAKLIAVVFFVLALWVGIRRQRLRFAALFYFLSFLTAYGGGIYHFFLKFLGVFRLM